MRLRSLSLVVIRLMFSVEAGRGGESNGIFFRRRILSPYGITEITLFSRQMAQMRSKDTRLKITNEVLSGIKVPRPLRLFPSCEFRIRII